jgi:hypothetical protein
MSLSAFQPPGALVLELLPAGMYYCRQSACNSHEGMLWVQLQPLSVRQMLELSRRTMQKNREIGGRVEASGLLRVLSEAFDSSIRSTFKFSRPPSCRVNTLGEWMHTCGCTVNAQRRQGRAIPPPSVTLGRDSSLCRCVEHAPL